jgi:peptidoglycan/xylan/chitin deacetylase (PgdA/CDA1 family)
MSLARRAKLVTLSCLRTAGATSAIASSRWRNNRFLILCYHGVSVADEHEWSELYVSPGHLRRRFAFLRAGGFTVLPLSRALELLDRGSLPPRSVVLTFDDGAADFSSRAYPLLQEFGYPATLYQTTYYCHDQRPVFDTIASYLLWKGRGRRVDLPAPVGGAQVIPEDPGARSVLHGRLRAYANNANLTAGEKDAIARDLAWKVGEEWAKIQARRLLHLMTPDELRALDPELVDVQLHTHRHRTPRDRALFEGELADNIAALRAVYGDDHPLEHFCYPSGDYDPRFLPWLKAFGVRSATTCDPGIVSRTTDRLLLPRLIDSMLTPDIVFEAWLAGVAAFLPQRRP